MHKIDNIEIEYHPAINSGSSFDHIAYEFDDRIFGVPDCYIFQRFDIDSSFKDIPDNKHSFIMLGTDDFSMGIQYDYHSFHSIN